MANKVEKYIDATAIVTRDILTRAVNPEVMQNQTFEEELALTKQEIPLTVKILFGAGLLLAVYAIATRNK